MLLLEGDALRHVYADFKRVFEEYDRGLTLHEFVNSFLRNVSFDAFSPKQLVKLLVDLFRYVAHAAPLFTHNPAFRKALWQTSNSVCTAHAGKLMSTVMRYGPSERQAPAPHTLANDCGSNSQRHTLPCHVCILAHLLLRTVYVAVTGVVRVHVLLY